MSTALRLFSLRPSTVKPASCQRIFSALCRRLSAAHGGKEAAAAALQTPRSSEPFSESLTQASSPKPSKTLEGCKEGGQGNVPPPNLAERMRQFFKRYGRIGLIVYLGISLLTFSSIYALVSMGVDVKSYLDRWGIELPEWSEKASGVMVAYLFYKLLMPIRLSLAMLLTPGLARYWGRIRK